jgi:Protein of unknown function (DUF3500)
MRAWKYALLVPLAVGLLTAAYERVRTDQLMVDAAKAYLASLNPDQRKQTSFGLDNMDERTHWLYTPFLRHGLTLREMTQTQRNLAHALLSAGLSAQGLVKAHTIMSLEEILYILERGDGDRDPNKYFLSIFGEPSERGAWGYRFEGHHLSVNYTIVDGKIASSPSFFGANPAQIVDGRRKGLRTLARQEDLGRKLLESLTEEQRAIAVVDKKAPEDMLTTNSRKAALNGQPNGLPFSKMTAPQKEAMETLIAEYANDFPPEIATQRMEQFRKLQGSAFFAWSGTTEPGKKHYYRVQTPEFLIEFDKALEDGNHIHSVWRDFKNDWGEDLLAAHYKASH